VWFGDARCVLWSDIPNNRILRWDEETGGTSVFRKPSNYSNGNTRDRQGRLITCEHDARRVTRTEYDGTVTVLMDKFEGKPLNSPNDVVVKSDDSIWFLRSAVWHSRQSSRSAAHPSVGGKAAGPKAAGIATCGTAAFRSIIQSKRLAHERNRMTGGAPPGGLWARACKILSMRSASSESAKWAFRCPY
jgi:SMP-30/gluconolaconase/LRE-like protein